MRARALAGHRGPRGDRRRTRAPAAPSCACSRAGRRHERPGGHAAACRQSAWGREHRARQPEAVRLPPQRATGAGSASMATAVVRRGPRGDAGPGRGGAPRAAGAPVLPAGRAPRQPRRGGGAQSPAAGGDGHAQVARAHRGQGPRRARHGGARARPGPARARVRHGGGRRRGRRSDATAAAVAERAVRLRERRSRAERPHRHDRAPDRGPENPDADLRGVPRPRLPRTARPARLSAGLASTTSTRGSPRTSTPRRSPLRPKRGPILDRAGQVLAVSSRAEPSTSRPSQVEDAGRLARAPGPDPGRARARHRPPAHAAEEASSPCARRLNPDMARRCAI